MKIKIALKVLFTKVERFLIRNNRKFVFSSDEISDKNSRDKKLQYEFSNQKGLGKNFTELLVLTGTPTSNRKHSHIGSDNDLFASKHKTKIDKIDQDQEKL